MQDREAQENPRLAVSVVVPTRDRAARLRGLLAALSRQTLTPDLFELVVVDDGSLDSTQQVLDEAIAVAPFAIEVVRGRGEGPAAARNAGWRRANGPLVAFTDDDCEPDAGWLEAGLSAVNTSTGVLVQGRTRPIEREAARLRLRSRTKWIDGPGPWYQTCNIFYPRELLESLGGFDEAFTRPFGEDVDLAWRALERGAGALFEPNALVRHAVEVLGPRDYVLSGVRDPDEALIFKHHPGLQREVRRLGMFKGDFHALLSLAGVALFAARKWWVLYALAVPYLAHVALRLHGGRTHPGEAPLVVARDTLELASAIRGAIRHRVPFV